MIHALFTYQQRRWFEKTFDIFMHHHPYIVFFVVLILTTISSVAALFAAVYLITMPISYFIGWI